MDQERFDRMTRTLATGQSRRGLLKGLTGSALGGVLAAVGIGEAAAKPEVPCKAPNTRCGKGKNATCCTSSQVCQGDGTCACAPSYELVNGGCFQIAPHGYPDSCTNVCVVSGSVADSFNYLCGASSDTTCASNSDCPSGSACQTLAGQCIVPC